MNTGERSQLGKHGSGSLHDLTWTCYNNNTDFSSQIKLTKLLFQAVISRVVVPLDLLADTVR